MMMRPSDWRAKVLVTKGAAESKLHGGPCVEMLNRQFSLNDDFILFNMRKCKRGFLVY
jgi:hypothetical protein